MIEGKRGIAIKELRCHPMPGPLPEAGGAAKPRCVEGRAGRPRIARFRLGAPSWRLRKGRGLLSISPKSSIWLFRRKITAICPCSCLILSACVAYAGTTCLPSIAVPLGGVVMVELACLSDPIRCLSAGYAFCKIACVRCVLPRLSYLASCWLQR